MSSSSTLPAGFVEGSWWFYAPNKIAPIVVASLFLISGLWHVYQNIRYRSWKSTGLLPVAPAVFVIGYTFRSIGAFDYTTISWRNASNISLLCSPPVFEAANWLVLCRLLYYVPYKAPLHPFFLTLSLGAFQSFIIDALTAVGASRADNPSAGQGNEVAGRILLQISFVFQVLSLFAFQFVAILFECNCRCAGVFPWKVKKPLRILYFSSFLINMRLVYRMIEWFQVIAAAGPRDDPANPDSFPMILRTEAFFYVFEASMMLTNSFLLNIFHPSKFLPSDFDVYLAEDGETEVRGQEVLVDRRPMWQQTVDPCDLYGLCTNRERRMSIWKMSVDARSTTSSESGSEKRSWFRWKNETEAPSVV